jgi:hypothetical protein
MFSCEQLQTFARFILPEEIIDNFDNIWIVMELAYYLMASFPVPQSMISQSGIARLFFSSYAGGGLKRKQGITFPKASRIIDRFYVQLLAFDALQEIRISHMWDAINEKTDAKKM